MVIACQCKILDWWKSCLPRRSLWTTGSVNCTLHGAVPCCCLPLCDAGGCMAGASVGETKVTIEIWSQPACLQLWTSNGMATTHISQCTCFFALQMTRLLCLERTDRHFSHLDCSYWQMEILWWMHSLKCKWTEMASTFPFHIQKKALTLPPAFMFLSMSGLSHLVLCVILTMQFCSTWQWIVLSKLLSFPIDALCISHFSP